LEHVPENELPTCWEIFKLLKPKTMFLVICTRKAGQILPNGTNAHKTVKPVDWWKDVLVRVFDSYTLGGVEISKTNEHVKFVFQYNYKLPTTVKILDVLDKKVGYFITPKCGSRTVVGWSTIIRNPELYKNRPELFEPSRTDMYVELRGMLHQLSVKELHAVPARFCVVRDPVERFVSAFTNRVIYLKKVKKELTISELIENFDAYSSQREIYGDIIHHAGPLSYFCGNDPSVFTHIFNLGDMSELKRLLEDIYSMHLPDIHLQQSGDCKKPKLTDSEIAWIKNKYASDYNIYGKWF
jgi:hypothetical protein